MGVKVWSLCDLKTEYLLKFNVYTGKSNIDVEKVFGSKVFLALMQGFFHKGHIVYVDNSF